MLQDSEIGAIATGGPFGHPPPSKYEKLISLANEVPPTANQRTSARRMRAQHKFPAMDALNARLRPGKRARTNALHDAAHRVRAGPER